MKIEEAGAPDPVIARHRGRCLTCHGMIRPGEEMIVAPGGLIRTYHPGDCWRNRRRRFRSRRQTMLEILGLQTGRARQ